MRSKGIIPSWFPLYEIGYVGDEAFFLLLHHPPAALYQPRGRGRPTPPLGPMNPRIRPRLLFFRVLEYRKNLKNQNSATTIHLLPLPPKNFGNLPGTRTHVERKNLM